jgi:hypothetical protein
MLAGLQELSAVTQERDHLAKKVRLCAFIGQDGVMMAVAKVYARGDGGTTASQVVVRLHKASSHITALTFWRPAFPQSALFGLPCHAILTA